MTEELNRDRWLAELRSRVAEVTATEARARQLGGALLVDVREDGERATGTPSGALGLSRGFLELRIEQSEPDRQREILVLCGSGQRSLLGAEALQRMGYRKVSSIAGGMDAWKAAGLPVSAGALDTDAVERYARQVLLPQIGEAGQARLGEARILLLGAGGLGSPALLYLAAAGVGRITVVDDDRVERSNLHRQVVHADGRVGMGKAESARMTMVALNPRVRVETVVDRLRAENVEDLIRGHDVVIDGADNFATRYLLAAATRRLGIPMVYAAIERFNGQASVFDPRRDDSPCYRCLFPEPPSAADAPNCSEAGVLGVLPGLVGLIQATEAMKLVLGIGQPLVGRLLTYDALGMRFRELALRRDPDCPGCGAEARFEGYVDLERMCASAG
ncbi:molybdopterin/thiamine biosynthesis adenylyltransferase/rhodanese-related sulfurtransferase [Luteibacter jiangsuensis]|uniref:Molybdopterin/thiamine biosynthesis adenylyltransferase/rhodanese-related sulfurtransferase n=1 Tax=Luteibacter jiangsuensis TaxID=637577 RepID=A0ABT9SVS5_9GAMM|nr:molybdopterin-synthase adenylyltransferase MoeB [Luteibacter jiangsuensis]MDQ0008097.1 molybdopterin/thiamine biosynthesis adenylyltransferase/rhodanese-related sulfurtransferase [Luteibacter jiangsuensis]